MTLTKFTTRILVILFTLPLIADEVQEYTPKSTLTYLLKNSEAVKTDIEEKGTVRLTGHLADKLSEQVQREIEVSKLESEKEELLAKAQLSPSRGPAIISADGISSGELEAVNYPSYGIPNQVQEEMSLKPESLNASGTGNLGSIAQAIGKFDDKSAGVLPIPYKVAPNQNLNKFEKNKTPATDKAGSPYEDRVSGTTFGKNPDDTSLGSLVKSGKKENDNLAKENAALEALKNLNKDKEKEEKEKIEAKERETISKIKDLQPDYDFESYKQVRDLFNSGTDSFAKLKKEDPAFQEKSVEIFDFVPENSSKSLSEMDSDRLKKKAYADAVSEHKESKKYPPQTIESQKRIRTERAH